MRSQHHRPFRFLFLLITAVAILPAFGIILFTGWESVKEKEETVRMEAMRQVETLAMTQSTITESVRQILNTLAILPIFQSDDYEAQSLLLQKVLRSYPEYNNFTFTDTRGIVRASARLESGADLSTRLHIRKALSGSGVTTGEYILAKTDMEPVFPFAFTVRDSRQNIIGVLTAVYSLTSYRLVFERLRLPAESIMGITDHQGVHIFFHPKKYSNPVGAPIKQEAWRQFSQGEEQGTVTFNGTDNIPRLYTYKKLYLFSSPDPYLYIVLCIPVSSIESSARLILFRNLLLIGASAIFSILISGILSHIAAGKDLNSLALTVSRIRSGDLGARASITRGTAEIVHVAEALDEMANTLEKRKTERDTTELELHTALKEKEILLKEVHHRVKNNLQIINSILHLEKNNTTDLQEFATQLESRILAISSVHEMMYLSNSLSNIDIAVFLPRLINISSSFYPGLQVEHDFIPLMLPLDQAVPLALMTNELITNAVKYGGSVDGKTKITMTISRDNDELLFSVQDNGPGFPEKFSKDCRESLGMILIQTLTNQLNGRIMLDNSPGGRIRIWFSGES